MKKAEERARKNIRKTALQEAILTTLFAGSKMTSSAVIPAVLNYLLDTDLPHYSRRNEVVKSAAKRLEKRGLVEFKNGHYSLTSAGQRKLEQWQKDDYKITVPKKWDGKWRVVIFDIPENLKRIRMRVREILMNAGFKRLQDSVWVIPYDCEDVIGLMKTELKIGKHILYIIADQIENDRSLRMDFDILKK